MTNEKRPRPTIKELETELDAGLQVTIAPNGEITSKAKSPETFESLRLKLAEVVKRNEELLTELAEAREKLKTIKDVVNR